MSIVWFVLATVAVIVAAIVFYDWHYSEPQRRKRALRAIVRGHRGRR